MQQAASSLRALGSAGCALLARHAENQRIHCVHYTYSIIQDIQYMYTYSTSVPGTGTRVVDILSSFRILSIFKSNFEARLVRQVGT